MEEESSYPFSGDRFLDGVENYPLYKAMVNHNQERVKARGGGEVSNEVTRELLKWARSVGFDWGEWRDGGVCI